MSKDHFVFVLRWDYAALTPRTAGKRSASWFLSLKKTRNSSAKTFPSFSDRLLPRTARAGQTLWPGLFQRAGLHFEQPVARPELLFNLNK